MYISRCFLGTPETITVAKKQAAEWIGGERAGKLKEELVHFGGANAATWALIWRILRNRGEATSWSAGSLVLGWCNHPLQHRWCWTVQRGGLPLLSLQGFPFSYHSPENPNIQHIADMGYTIHEESQPIQSTTRLWQHTSSSSSCQIFEWIFLIFLYNTELCHSYASSMKTTSSSNMSNIASESPISDIVSQPSGWRMLMVIYSSLSVIDRRNIIHSSGDLQ